jgi:cytochrome P450
MAGARGVRRLVRWGLRHGVPRVVMARRARAGDLGARIMFDTGVRAEPFPYYEQLRARGRLVEAGVARCSVDYGLCSAVLRSPDFGSAVPVAGRLPLPVRLAVRVAGRPSLSAAEAPSMLVADPPEHTRYRRLVTRAFSARAVAALRTRTEEIAEELLDAMAARGPQVDLVRGYAALLPVTVIAEVLGAPRAMREQFLRWGADGVPLVDFGIGYREFRRGELAVDALHGWMLQHFEALRREPGENILSALVAARDESGGLSDDELSSMAMLLLEAGFETTVNLIGNGVALLTRHRDQLEVLRCAPGRWPGAVDEVLRFDSPVQRTARLAHRSVEIAGERVRAGELVIAQLGGANRDPAVFADPQRFDVTRADAGKHLGFSAGIHYCVGAALAKMEGEVGLHALFDRFPDLALTVPPRRRPSPVLRGYDTMPATLSPNRVPA